MSAVVSPISLSTPRATWLHWVPALALPTLVLLAGSSWPPALVAWLLAGTIFGGFKWLAFASSWAARRATLLESWHFLFLWPGMDADAFFTEKAIAQPTGREVAMAAALTLAGLIILLTLPELRSYWPVEVLGWLGLVGLALFLLFGLTQFISIAWRIAGVDAQPIMNKPLRATSLADFWGARWNLAFHDIGRLFVWRPIAKRWGFLTATLGVFLFSGIVHDVVMSIPARGGLGLPTLYFLLQGGAVLFERSRIGKRWGLSRGWRGRVYAAVFVLAPLGLLFHQPFLQRVVLPSLEWATPR